MSTAKEKAFLEKEGREETRKQQVCNVPSYTS